MGNPKPAKGQNLSRRDLLKTIAAAGGAIAASAFLPSKWRKPIIQAGVLPAHAQASLGYRISQCVLIGGPFYPGSPVPSECTVEPPDAGVPLRAYAYLVNPAGEFARDETLVSGAGGLCQWQCTLPSGCDNLPFYIVWEIRDPSFGTDACQTGTNVTP